MLHVGLDDAVPRLDTAPLTIDDAMLDAGRFAGGDGDGLIDGAPPMPSDSEPPGRSPVHAALLEVVDRPLPEISDHVLAVTAQWCEQLQDDATLVVARRVEL